MSKPSPNEVEIIYPESDGKPMADNIKFCDRYGTGQIRREGRKAPS